MQQSGFEQASSQEIKTSDVLSVSDIPRASLAHVLSLIESVLDEEATFELGTKVPVSKNEGQSISNGYNNYSVPTGVCCTMGRFAPANSNIFVTISNMVDVCLLSAAASFPVIYRGSIHHLGEGLVALHYIIPATLMTRCIFKYIFIIS